MNESLDLLDLIKKEKHVICKETYSFYALAAFTLSLSYLFSRSSSYSISVVFFIPIFFFLAIYFAVLGLKAQERFSSKLIEETSQKARSILERVSCGNHPGPFYLYLKPFKISHRLLVRNPDRFRSRLIPSFFFPTYFLPEYVEWETLLAKTLEESAPLLGLGFSPGTSGANYIEVKKWKKAALTLMEHARLIFIVPSDSEGTKWEIEMLKKGNYLSKCLFIFPEGLDPFNFTISRSWLTLRNSMAQIGIEIPEYNRKGVAFTLDEKGELTKKITPFSLSRRSSIFSIRKYPNPQTLIKEYFPLANDLDRIEYSIATSELKALKHEAVVDNRACMVERKKQINKILEGRSEKMVQWFQKLEYFEANGYLDLLDEEKKDEQSFEEQVVIRFIEAICFDDYIIQFIDSEAGEEIFKYTIKYFRLIKSTGNNVYVEIHQQDPKGLNVVRFVKFTISEILITNIELIKEKTVERIN